MRILSKLIVVIFGAGALLLLYVSYKVSLLSALEVSLTALLPFVIVSVLRRVIDAKRPYELYEFYLEKPKDKGRSCPSRHVYSATVIATLTVFVYPILGGVLLFFALMLAVLRVLLGIHFIRDVVCGALVGALAAIIGVLIFTPF